MTRYLSGLCVAGLGLCGGGWLIVATAAFGVAGGGSAGKVNLATGAGLILASCVAIVAWAAAWRRRMRTDGVLGRRFLLVTRREARRNRRDLSRDVRRATRLAQRAARQARRGARGPAGLAGGEVHGGHSASGAASASGATGHAFSGHAPSTAAWSAAGPDGAGLAGAGLNGYSGHHGSAHRGGGHDGASAADVLGELRTLRALLGPLVATAHAPVLQARAQPRPAARPPQAAPRLPEAAPAPLEQARQEAGLLAGDDELLRLADSEEAWW
jgi:hypothetical protein